MRFFASSSTRQASRPRFVGAQLFMLVATIGCADEPGPVATFEELWAEFDGLYGGFALRGVDWDAAYEQHRPLVHDDMSDDELHAVLTSMLALTDDAHVNLIAPEREAFVANALIREAVGYWRFDDELVREHYLGDDVYADDYLTMGTLAAGPTYLHLPFIGPQMVVLPSVLADAEQTGGLILDLRHNSGGDVTAMFSALSSMTASERPVLRARTRSGPGRDEFTDWYEWSIPAGGTEVDFPIVVLTDRYTGSAAEWMVLALSTFDQVVFVGEPTSGALSAVLGRELANGWQVTISVQEVTNLDGSTIEGIGFFPDELIENDYADMALGIDAVLDRAIELATSR